MTRVVFFDELQRFLFLSHQDAGFRQHDSRNFSRRIVFLLCGVHISQQPALAIPCVSRPCPRDGVVQHEIVRGLRRFFALCQVGWIVRRLKLMSMR